MNRVLERLSKTPFAVVGHRGAAGLAPENTLAAFRKALELGVDAVEVDVQLTLDGVPVALHDEDLLRVAGAGISVRRSRLADLGSVKIGGEPLATLEEVLRTCAERAGILVEIKTPGDEAAVAEVIRSAGAEEWVAVISFHESVLSSFSKILKIPLGLVYSQPPGKIFEAKRLGSEIVLPRYSLATAKAVEIAHRLGMRVVAWTVNQPRWVEELWKRGVDGIATDYPDMALRIRALAQKS